MENNPAFIAQQEKASRDHHGAEYYQKGAEISHGATGTEDHKKAIEYFSIAISLQATHPRYFFARGNCFRSINEYEAAVADFTSAIDLDDKCGIYYGNRGTCKRKLGYIVPALEDFTMAIEFDNKKGNHYFNRALVLYEASYFREAILDFSKALEEGFTGSRLEFRAYHSRGNCYRRLGYSGLDIDKFPTFCVPYNGNLIEKCIEDMKRAIEIEPRNPSGYNFLGQAYSEFNEYDSAIENFTFAINLHGGNASYFNNRGLANYKKGGENIRLGLVDFHNAIKLDGKDSQAYFNRGIARLSLGFAQLGSKESDKFKLLQRLQSTHFDDSDEEAELISKIRTISAQDLVSTKNLKIKHASPEVEENDKITGYMSLQEQLQAALDDIDYACSLNPDSAKMFFGRGLVCQVLKDYEGACIQFKLAINLNDMHLASKFHLGLNYHILGDHEAALSVFSELVEICPEEVVFYECRGLVLQEMQHHQEAVDDYTVALSLKADDSCNLYHRAESFLRLENYKLALEDLNKAIEFGFNTGGVYNARGVAFRGLGLREAGMKDLSLAVDKDKRNGMFRFNRGILLIELGRYIEARNDLKIATKYNKNNPRILYYAALASRYQYIFDEAIDYLHQALQNNPTEHYLADLHYNLGLAYANKEEHMKAIECYSDAIANAVSKHKRICYIHERAKSLQLEQYYEEALLDFNETIEYNPNNAHAYFRRGFVHKNMGNLVKAATDLETAKMLDPTNPQLIVNYKSLNDTECIILCRPGEEIEY